MIRFVLVDFGCGLDRGLLAARAEAITLASRLFADPKYGWDVQDATARVGASPADVLDGEIVHGYYTSPDQPGALAYHSVDPRGRPYTKVFPSLTPESFTPTSPDATIDTHETCELAGDEDCETAVVCSYDAKVRLKEACDPVEDTALPVTLASGQSVQVSNFVSDWYFADLPVLGSVPLDGGGVLARQGQLTAGGYQTFFAPGQGYTQVTGPAGMRPYRKALAALDPALQATRSVAKRSKGGLYVLHGTP